MAEVFEGVGAAMSWQILEGDCRAILPGLADSSVDSVVTDPPYELGFMGKAWDASGVAFSADVWREVLRVLKPGGHLLAFGGTRTYHRMTCAIEDAGFEVRDSLHWMYGTGFPKSLDVSKAIDGAAGAEREVVRTRTKAGDIKGGAMHAASNEVGVKTLVEYTAPATEAAKQWNGWGTALKPGHEPIVLARKPLEGTVAANVQKWGTGGLNIDGCRIGTEVTGWGGGANRVFAVSGSGVAQEQYAVAGEARPVAGRWPANVLLDEDAAAELDAQSGTLKSGNLNAGHKQGHGNAVKMGNGGTILRDYGGDSGGASRFFYVAKPDGPERGLGSKNSHPTVKPVELMRHLVRLVTPPGGLVLDPFLGSGTTLVAAVLEDVRGIGIELEASHAEIARKRIGKTEKAAPMTRNVSRVANMDERQTSIFDAMGSK